MKSINEITSELLNGNYEVLNKPSEALDIFFAMYYDKTIKLKQTEIDAITNEIKQLQTKPFYQIALPDNTTVYRLCSSNVSIVLDYPPTEKDIQGLITKRQTKNKQNIIQLNNLKNIKTLYHKLT